MEWSSYSNNVTSHSRYVSVLLGLSLLVFLRLLIEFLLLPFVLVFFFCFILKQVFFIGFIVMCIVGVSNCFRFPFFLCWAFTVSFMCRFAASVKFGKFWLLFPQIFSLLCLLS